MITSEPTTREIVRALRYCADVNSICGDACPAHIDEDGCRTVLMQNAADRLESQAKQIAELTAAIKTQSDLCRECAALTVIEQKVEIDALTARLRELAEAERENRLTVYNYPNCYACPRLPKTNIWQDDEPCKSCRARALAATDF